MRDEPVKPYFLCGKMAAGKSTFAKYAARLREALSLHVRDILSHGVPVGSAWTTNAEFDVITAAQP